MASITSPLTAPVVPPFNCDVHTTRSSSVQWEAAYIICTDASSFLFLKPIAHSTIVSKLENTRFIKTAPHQHSWRVRSNLSNTTYTVNNTPYRPTSHLQQLHDVRLLLRLLRQQRYGRPMPATYRGPVPSDRKNVCNLASAPGYQWKGNLRGDKKLNWGHCGTRTRGVIIPERDTPKISKQFCPYCTERRPKLKAASTRAKNEEPRRQSKMEMRERAATPGRAVTPGQGRAPAKAKAPADQKAPAMAKASKRDATPKRDKTLARDPTPGPATTPAQPSTPVRASPAPEASPPQGATPPAWARNSESPK
jgi:hypothetical protein